MRLPPAVATFCCLAMASCSKSSSDPGPTAAQEVRAPSDRTPDAGGLDDRARSSTCPEGMLLVPGGSLSAKQRTRWADWLPNGNDQVAPFCLDRLLVSHADVRRLYDTGCPDPETCLELQRRTDRDAPDVQRRLERACPNPSQCAKVRHPSVLADADRQDKPYTMGAPRRAAEVCESFGKRLPTAAEYLWAAAGGEEDRRYPWGMAPLDRTRAGVFDEGDYGVAVEALRRNCAENPQDDICYQERGCAEDPDHAPAICVSTKQEIADGRPATIARPFPWDDGYLAPEIPADAFPAGDGRWGHRRLFPAQVVEFPSNSARTSSWGRCGLLPSVLKPNAVDDMQTTAPCGDLRSVKQLFRCASAPSDG
jgi:hypothetical protein